MTDLPSWWGRNTRPIRKRRTPTVRLKTPVVKLPKNAVVTRGGTKATAPKLPRMPTRA